MYTNIGFTYIKLAQIKNVMHEWRADVPYQRKLNFKIYKNLFQLFTLGIIILLESFANSIWFDNHVFY